MNKKQKEMYSLKDDEVRVEVWRRIKECRDKKKRKLDLSHYRIKEIPPELAELDGLTELDLLNIDQTNLPDFLGNLTGLKTLRIGSAYSSPHERPAYIVPDTLANLTKLQRLYLGYNIPEIPSWIFTLKNLKMLTICNDEIDAIPPLIKNFTRLEGLQIHGEKITDLPESLGHLTSLRKIKAITLKKTIKKPGKKSSRSREPDLVGKDKNGLWHIFEAKGTTSDSLDGKVNDAKIQANQVVTICGQKPSTRSVCATYLGHDKIFSQIKDPENDEKKEIDINMEKYYNYYYFPFVALKKYAHSESYRSTINNLYYDSFDIYIENKKLSIGLDSEIAALLQEKKYERITEYFKKRQNTEFYFNHDDHLSI
ncbi:hypothetical protein FACS189496_1130 [Bacilli bacterium]|nr:hypothetical protein FACS189496_1130 [Bacilli bacterium]